MFLHVLTHVVFSLSACSITCCVFARAEEDLSHLPSTHHTAPELGCSSPCQNSVGHIVVGMVVDSAVPRVVHFKYVAGNASIVGVCASKVCTQTAILHLSPGFARLGFPRSCTRLLWIVVLPLRPPNRDPTKALVRVDITLE